MASSVRHANLTRFLTGWYRAELAARPESYCEDFRVGGRIPDATEDFPARFLLVSYNGSTRESVVSAEASVALLLFAGTRAEPQDADDAALLVMALAEKLPSLDPGNPVTVLRGATGPFAIDEEQDRSVRLMNLTLGVIGIPL